jgi:hypothetical protein
MRKAIVQNSKVLSGYFHSNIGWEGFAGLIFVFSFLILGQL